jgi:ethanolamine ammonia-lyase small subunit
MSREIDSREIDKLDEPQALPTTARLSLGLTGAAIPTREQLRFQLDHALARDAVHTLLDIPALLHGLQQRGRAGFVLRSAIEGESRQKGRHLYLRRPDLGRTLHPDFAQALRDYAASTPEKPDVAFILVDGLSALAIERHALPLLDALLPTLDDHSSLAPICIVSQGRVAIGDEIGHLLGAKLVVLMIGERPGLSSPDSLGVYITWNPLPGRTDAERNCVSNIRQEGLSYNDAAQRIAFYMKEARRLETTGVALKESSGLKGG